MISINTGDGREHIKDMLDDVPVMPRLRNLYKGRDIPIQLWKSIPMGQDLGIEQFGGETTRQSVGIVGAGVDSICVTDPLDNVHVYDKGFVDVLDAKAGEHVVWDGAYVGQLTATNEAIVNVHGHIGRLIVDAGAQVTIREGAYIDHMEVKPFGYARVEAKAAIHYLCVRIDGKCLLSTEAKLHTVVADPGNKLCRMLETPAQTPMFSFEVHLYKKETEIQMAKDMTEAYKSNHNELKLSNVSLWKLHHCQLSIDGLTFCADCARSLVRDSKHALPLPQAVYQDLKHYIISYKQASLPTPSLRAWYKGKPVDMTPHKGWCVWPDGTLQPDPNEEEYNG